MIGAAAAALAACGGSSGSSGATPAQGAVANSAAGQAKTDTVEIIGKIDAESGPPGTFTGKEHWPAFSPGDVRVSAGRTVVLTIKEYDDMATALPDGSPYNKVMGGTEVANGKAVTTVSNNQIAHTITIPSLGINIPLPKAPEGGVTTVTFTFKAPAAGTYKWFCLTPCGNGPGGMGGAMKTDDWMRGHLVVT